MLDDPLAERADRATEVTRRLRGTISAGAPPPEKHVQPRGRGLSVDRLDRVQERFLGPPEWEATQSSGQGSRHGWNPDLTKQGIGGAFGSLAVPESSNV